MRAFGSRRSGWQDSSGRVIVKRRSAKSPRARRSWMCRWVSSYGAARRSSDRVEAKVVGDRELGPRHAEIVPTNAYSHAVAPRRRA